jgi:hypothetical protein
MMKLALLAIAAFAFGVFAWAVGVHFAPFHSSSLPTVYP